MVSVVIILVIMLMVCISVGGSACLNDVVGWDLVFMVLFFVLVVMLLVLAIICSNGGQEAP